MRASLVRLKLLGKRITGADALFLCKLEELRPSLSVLILGDDVFQVQAIQTEFGYAVVREGVGCFIVLEERPRIGVAERYVADARLNSLRIEPSPFRSNCNLHHVLVFGWFGWLVGWLVGWWLADCCFRKVVVEGREASTREKNVISSLYYCIAPCFVIVSSYRSQIDCHEGILSITSLYFSRIFVHFLLNHTYLFS